MKWVIIKQITNHKTNLNDITIIWLSIEQAASMKSTNYITMRWLRVRTSYKPLNQLYITSYEMIKYQARQTMKPCITNYKINYQINYKSWTKSSSSGLLGSLLLVDTQPCVHEFI